tara:strand:- start:212 stop:484 length:273 start_codon:yes stop_codon:yes gene_type:complete
MLGKVIAGFLFVGVLNMPYGYYRLLRIIVTISSALYCFQFFEKNKMNMVYLFGFIAILFNPLIPIFFNKEIWIVIDIVVSGLFLYFNPKD